MMRRWATISLGLLITFGLFAPAWANEELHPGGRAFFPLWDTSTSQRLTFIILTRLALNDNTAITKVSSTDPRFVINNTFDNCRPRGDGSSDNLGNGNTLNLNRVALGGTTASPTFVDDVHIEYYGKNCQGADETIHMSCADIDLLLLSSTAPRTGFSGIAVQGQGAVEAHFVLNSPTGAPAAPERRKLENSLMGNAVISDLAEGWAATYPAAIAKATSCNLCDEVDGGTEVGYEPFGMEAYLPFSLADGFPTQGGGTLVNFLSLWSPSFLPASVVGPTNVQITWWDGRERPFPASRVSHAVLENLTDISSQQFNVSNFICGHTATGSNAENDGFPRTGATSTTCTTPDVADPTHKSDNIEAPPSLAVQTSTPIGWWRFVRSRFGNAPAGAENPPGAQFDGKGLVGVVLSHTAGNPTAANGVGDAIRLWHKDPCEIATHGSIQSYGPPHLRDRFVENNEMVFFNTFSFANQAAYCAGTLNFP
jgi:hypothetical protein